MIEPKYPDDITNSTSSKLIIGNAKLTLPNKLAEEC